MLYGMETVAMMERQVEKNGSFRVENGEMGTGSDKKGQDKKEYVRGTVKIAKLGDKLRNARLRWNGHVKRKEEGYLGK